MVANKAAAPDAAANDKLPMGHYTLVSIDIDTTGRRLIDEIVQLAAYSPKSHYEQYIMPYMNLNPAARQRHQVRVISIGFYRMLKSMQTCKIIKSKSEIAALKDFLDWLEALKAQEEKSLGVILVCHEDRKFIPYMILQAFNKYNLLGRFLNTVAAFTNSRMLAQQLFSKEGALRQPYTLRRLARYINMKIAENDTINAEGAAAISRVCGNGNANDEFDGNASVRARLTYEVAYYLCNLEHNNNNTLESKVGYEHLLAALLEQCQPIQADLCELENQNENVERQNSFRPVFFVYFRATLFHRMRAVKFRIILAEHGFDLNALNAIWQQEGRDGLLSALQTVSVLKPEERHELVDLFDSYFDPKKTVIGPVVKNNRRRNRRPSNNPRNGTKNEGNSARAADEPGAGGDKQQLGGAARALPDSTTKTLNQPNGGGNNNYNKTGRGKRFNPRVRNGFRQPRFNQQQTKNQHNNAGVAVMNSGGNMTGAAALPQAQRVAVAN